MEDFDAAWSTATADGVEKHVNYFKPTARETYEIMVPEDRHERRAMRDLRDLENGRTRPRGLPRP